MVSEGWVQKNLPELLIGILVSCGLILVAIVYLIVAEAVSWIGQHESAAGLVIVLVALSLVAMIVLGDQQNRRN